MNTQKQPITFTDNVALSLKNMLEATDYDRLFVLADETTVRLCLPEIEIDVNPIVIPAGDQNKNIHSVTHVWQSLGQGEASRRSVLINLGGGMVTDLGGFAASTFKRGIRFINIPTTLLAMVDASVGGKAGINFNGLKNEIGVFNNAEEVIIDTRFLKTLDFPNILSGYAEMLKHSLISSIPEWAELINFSIDTPNLSELSQLLRKNIQVKQHIVLEDPLERGLRKALNVGHTIGHALESFALSRQQPVLHGYAVAWGIICELYLSTVKTHFPADQMRQTVSFIRRHYGSMTITCDDYPALLQFMTHDKKNTSGHINFTLLDDIGHVRLNQTATREEICEALDFYREAI